MQMSDKVPFSKTNVGRCKCPGCPVQAKSRCVAEKIPVMKEALKGSTLKPEEIPAEYCATGTATCRDIDTKQTCLCGTCSVFANYRLGAGDPGGYFCQYGIAR